MPPDVLEHPMPFPVRLDYAAKRIRSATHLQLYEEVRQAAEALKLGLWSCCQDGEHSPMRSYCIPGRQLQHALDRLDAMLKLDQI